MKDARIAQVRDRTGASALRDHGWDVPAAIDFIRRKMPIKAKEVPNVP